MLAYGDSRPVMVPVALAKAVAKDDLSARADDGTLYKASEQTWDTDLATTQAAFVAKFLGSSAQDKIAAEYVYGNAGIDEGNIRVNTGGVVPFTAAAGTYILGDLVGPAKQSGNLLENQKVAKVASEALAIGRVRQGFGVNPSVLYVELLSKILPAARQS
jgi:hypothetical protein